MATIVRRAEVQGMLDQGAQLVDVLPREEYESEHIPGAVNLPLKELDRESARRLDRGRPVILYCNDFQ